MIAFNNNTQELYRYVEISRKIKTALPVNFLLPLNIITNRANFMQIGQLNELIKIEKLETLLQCCDVTSSQRIFIIIVWEKAVFKWLPFKMAASIGSQFENIKLQYLQKLEVNFHAVCIKMCSFSTKIVCLWVTIVSCTNITAIINPAKHHIKSILPTGESIWLSKRIVPVKHMHSNGKTLRKYLYW